MRTEDVHPRVTLIKSSNPHLAGGEKYSYNYAIPLTHMGLGFTVIYIYIFPNKLGSQLTTIRSKTNIKPAFIVG